MTLNYRCLSHPFENRIYVFILLSVSYRALNFDYFHDKFSIILASFESLEKPLDLSCSDIIVIFEYATVVHSM